MKLTKIITEEYNHVEKNIELNLERGIAYSEEVEKIGELYEKWLDVSMRDLLKGMITKVDIIRSSCHS